MYTLRLMSLSAAAARSRWSSSPRQVAEGGSSGSVSHRARALIRSAPSHTAGKVRAVSAILAIWSVCSSRTTCMSKSAGRLSRPSLGAVWRRRDFATRDIIWRASTAISSRSSCARMWYTARLSSPCAWLVSARTFSLLDSSSLNLAETSRDNPSAAARSSGVDRPRSRIASRRASEDIKPARERLGGGKERTLGRTVLRAAGTPRPLLAVSPPVSPSCVRCYE